MIAVRAAAAGDVATLVRLNGDVQRAHAALEPGVFRDVVDEAALGAFFAGRLVEDAHGFALGCGGGEALGYVWFEVQDRPGMVLTLPQRRVYVHHLSVCPKARRAGVGSALMRYVEGRAAAAGIGLLGLESWAANGAAQAFFAACGYGPSRIGLAKRLG